MRKRESGMQDREPMALSTVSHGREVILATQMYQSVSILLGLSYTLPVCLARRTRPTPHTDLPNLTPVLIISSLAIGSKQNPDSSGKRRERVEPPASN